MNKEFESIKRGIHEATNVEKHKAKLMKNPKFKEAYENTQFGRPWLTQEDLDDMEKAIRIGESYGEESGE